MSQILDHHHLGAIVSTAECRVSIGKPGINKSCLVEFSFTSTKALVRVLDSLRLLSFSEAFLRGELNIKGDILQAIEVVDIINSVTDRRQTLSEKIALALFLAAKAVLPRFATRFEASDHYGTSSAVYELMLDSHVQYTCGYFRTGSEDITEAQEEKFKLIRELVEEYAGPLAQLSHLDIGCGWGGMASYFRDNFGTRSVGNTNSIEQMEYAQNRNHCEVIFGDFSTLQKRRERYDIITVVGMIEHLTPSRRSLLLKTIRQRLSPNGVVYLQCIVKPAVWIGGDAYRFVQNEVFPGHYLETSAATETRIEDAGFDILRRIDHTAHYGLTTACWVRNLQEHEAEIKNLVGERSYRVYLAYLAFASRLFATERGGLMRYLLKVPN